MRTITQTELQEMFAVSTDRAGIWLVTVDHSSLGSPLRFSSDTVTTNYGGNAYTPLPYLDVRLGEQSENAEPKPQIVIDNIGQALVPLVRSISEPADVTLEAVTIDKPGTVRNLIGPIQTKMLSADNNLQTMTLGLGDEDILNRSAIRDRFTPGISPALFQ